MDLKYTKKAFGLLVVGDVLLPGLNDFQNYLRFECILIVNLCVYSLS